MLKTALEIGLQITGFALKATLEFTFGFIQGVASSISK